MQDRSPHDEETTGSLPKWVSQLEPEIAGKLAEFDTDELFELEATIEWYDGHPPPHIAVQGLEQAVPGCGKLLIEEGIERSRLERRLANRHSWINIAQSTAAQVFAAVFSAGALGTCAYIVTSDNDLSWTKLFLTVTLLVVGVGGPISAAILANNMKLRADQNSDPE